MNRLALLITSIILTSCVITTHPLMSYKYAHADFIKDMDRQVGGKTPIDVKPYKYKWAGEFLRIHVKKSIGLTKVSTDKNGNIVRHWHKNEFLPTYFQKEVVGKCLVYQIIDPKTGIILDWGFDKGGNPKSCWAWFP